MAIFLQLRRVWVVTGVTIKKEIFLSFEDASSSPVKAFLNFIERGLL